MLNFEDVGSFLIKYFSDDYMNVLLPKLEEDYVAANHYDWGIMITILCRRLHHAKIYQITTFNVSFLIVCDQPLLSSEQRIRYSEPLCQLADGQRCCM